MLSSRECETTTPMLTLGEPVIGNMYSQYDHAEAMTPVPCSCPEHSYLQFIEALKSEDAASVSDWLLPSRLSDLRALANSHGQILVRLVRRLYPRDLRVVGTTICGGEATLQLTGTRRGNPVRGIAQLVAHGHQWRIAFEQFVLES